MVAPVARTGVFADVQIDDVDPAKRGRPNKAKTFKPIAPFERDPDVAAASAFCRETGEPVSIEALKTYAEVLALYHLSPEDKFENGRPFDAGETSRRHIRVLGIQLIGKEANKVGDFGECDPVRSAVAQLF